MRFSITKEGKVLRGQALQNEVRTEVRDGLTTLWDKSSDVFTTGKAVFLGCKDAINDIMSSKKTYTVDELEYMLKELKKK